MNPHHLQLLPAAGQPLSPEQRRFNQLVAKIDRLRATLAQWQAQRPVAAEALARRAGPLNGQIHAAQCRLAHALEAQCNAPGWTPAQRRVWVDELCELLDLLIDDELTTVDDAALFKAIYERRADVSREAERQESVQAMRAMFEDATGVDLGEAEFASEEELLAHAQRRLHEQLEAEQAAEQAARAARPPRKQTAAQRRRAQEAEAAAQSQREIYRKLASALHPDRADDPDDRARRTALMTRVNQANDAGDLLALFALQLEIEQVDAAHIARATAERARHYNQLLAAQVKALEAEVEAQQMAARADFFLDPFEPIRPQQLAALVEEQLAQLRAVLAQAERMLRQLAEPAGAKRLVRDLQRERKRFERGFDIRF